MRILKIAAVLLLVPIMAYYFSACSSAEQTTGKLAYQRGEFKKAEEEFMKETKQNPNNEEAWFWLAMSRVQLRNKEGAKEAIDQYRAQKKNTFQTELVNAWYALMESGGKSFTEGDKLADQKRTDEAVKSYNEASHNFEMALIILPDSTVAKENIDVVQSRIAPILISPIIDKGIEYQNQEKFDLAIAEYERALKLTTRGTANYELVTYDISVAYVKWGASIRTKNETLEPDKQDTSYKEKFLLAEPYLLELVSSKDVCNQYNAYVMLVSVYALTGRSDEGTAAIAKRDELKPECDKKKEGK